MLPLPWTLTRTNMSLRHIKMTESPRIDRRPLLAYLRSQFQLDWRGIHGVAHWSRVRINGLLLAPANGANAHVVELFAFFHDSRRQNERQDEGHGRRAADLAVQLRDRFYCAADSEMEHLVYACESHSDGIDLADITVMTCWDADRLDLGRVGIEPLPQYLCTTAARDASHLLPAHARALAWKQLHCAKN